MSIENVTTFLSNVKEHELAKTVLYVFGKYAQTFEQFDDVSKSFFKIKDYNASILYGEKAHELANSPEELYTIRHNLINVYNHNNMPEKALEYIAESEKVIEIDNDRDFEKSFAYFLLNRKSEAAKILRDKLPDPTLTKEQRIKTEFNLGTYDLIDGNLQQGLRRFLLAGEEMGIHKTFINQAHNDHKLPRWNGVIKPGMKLLVVAEAGIGDEIINVRFMHEFADYGINAIWLTLDSRADLCRIYRLNGIPAFSNIEQVPVEFLQNCNYIPSMQVPIFLNCEYKDLWKGTYLTNIPIEYNEKWTRSMKSSFLKIGIRWQGNPAYDQDLHRSIPLVDIVNSIHIEAELFSLQKDNGMEELNDVINVTDLSYRLDTLSDLFACINQLDIVITSCTSIAHIAGAMGKEVCVIVPISCYYVWCNPTDKTPWYGDNVHIFYQKQPRSWIEPLNQLKQYLCEK